MADNFYSDMQNIAGSLLNKFKQGVIQYVAIVPGNGPVDDPGKASEIAFTLDATARGVSFKYIDNTTIVATDLQVTAAVHPEFVPDMNGFVKIDNVRHKIVAIMKKPAAGVTVANVLIVRK